MPPGLSQGCAQNLEIQCVTGQPVDANDGRPLPARVPFQVGKRVAAQLLWRLEGLALHQAATTEGAQGPFKPAATGSSCTVTKVSGKKPLKREAMALE